MYAINTVELMGNLASEPELKTFPNGAILEFSVVATNDSYTDRNTGEFKTRTTILNVEVKIDALARSLAGRLKKGSGVYVVGEKMSRRYQANNGETRTYHSVVVDAYTTSTVKTVENGSASFLTITLQGRAGKDGFTVREIDGGRKFVYGSIANGDDKYISNGVEKRKPTQWHKVISNSPLVSGGAAYVGQGDMVTVSGSLENQKSEVDGRTFYDLVVRADRLFLMGGRKSQEQSQSSRSYNTDAGYAHTGPGYAQPPMGGPSDLDDEIPF